MADLGLDDSTTAAWDRCLHNFSDKDLTHDYSFNIAAATAADDDDDDEKDADEDERFKLRDFWADLTQIDDKIVAFFDDKLEAEVVRFATAFLNALAKYVVELQQVVITAEHTYQMLRKLPVLRDILPADTLTNEVVPSPDHTFHNWGLTQQTTPAKIAHLNSVDDIVAFIAEARAAQKQVRVTMYSHSWSPMFADTGAFLGKLLPSEFSSLNPTELPLETDAELTEIRVPQHPLMYVRLDMDSNRVTVGGAATNLMYIQLVERRLAAGLTTFPSEIANVIQLHQSFVGTHAISCHGAGLATTAITDYVRRIDVINWRGERVVYEGREVLDRIGCHFGLLGVVVEMEVQFRPTYYALYRPFFTGLSTYMPETGQVPQLQREVEDNWYNEC